MADAAPSIFRRGQIAGALFLALGATCGALGAHALEDVMSSDRLESWGTASLYLLVMGAGLVGASHSSSHRLSQAALDAVGVGTLLFSGSIMGLVTLATMDVGAGWRAFLGPITPLGGVLMIGGWIGWAWSLRSR